MKPDLKTLLTRARAFADFWKTRTDERREKDTFWNEFFAIFGIDRKRIANFEYAVKDSKRNTQFADIFWEQIFLAEHKSAKKDLEAAKGQAERYLHELEREKPEALPEYYAVCDFARFWLFRREPLADKENEWKFDLEELPSLIERGVFDFMFGIEAKIREIQEAANIKAAEAIGRLHDALKEQNIYEAHELRLLATRLLFLFFADDSAVFGRNFVFQDLLEKTRPADLGERLRGLFEYLDTPPQKRNAKQNQRFGEAGFEYVNGGLFAEPLREFDFTEKQHQAMLACSAFDWRGISPEIFGTLFQSVMDADERREAGAHYTETANIDKVINGLFLDGLHAEFADIKTQKDKIKTAKLAAFYQKIQNLQFLDPACGSGNFLIVAYDRLRALEDDIIAEAQSGSLSGSLFGGNPSVQCRLNQFHGIETDEFAVLIARTAMWLKNHQCNIRTLNRFEGKVECHTLPLTDGAEIVQANSLHQDWGKADYIFGNPPFIGSIYQTKEQKADTAHICGHIKNHKTLDYVCNWYVKAAAIMVQNPAVQTAFVSTNSICQGEQVEILWGKLLSDGIRIRFAHQTFQWTSQAKGKAAVHCIIVGFQHGTPSEKRLYTYPDIKGEPVKHQAANINPYLLDAADIIVGKRSSQISGEPEMTKGSQPTDGGNLLLSTEEKNALTAAEPLAANYIRPFLGAEEFLNGKQRWCLWFDGIVDVKRNADLKHMPQVAARIAAVKAMREDSSSKQTQKDAATPWLFQQIRQPASGNYLLIPSVSSETRRFVPIGYLPSETVASNLVFTLPEAEHYHFGILCSSMHNAFMRAVAGRLKSDYRYSNLIVYNNFPFPFAKALREDGDSKEGKAAAEAAAKIAEAAQKILAARETIRKEAVAAEVSPPTLAELYRPGAGYADLEKAHADLDKAVDAAYGYKGGKDDASRLQFLFDLYAKTREKAETPPKKA